MPPSSSDSIRIEKIFGLGALLLLVAATFFVVRPFLSAVLLAAILTVSTWPLHMSITGALGGRRAYSAGIICLVFTLLLVVPLIFLVTSLGSQADTVTSQVRILSESGLPPAPSWVKDLPFIGNKFADRWDAVSKSGSGTIVKLQPYIATALEWLLKFGASFGKTLFDLCITLIVTFIFLRDGTLLAERLEAIVSRLAGTRAKDLIETAGLTLRGVVYGILGTAVVQAVLAWIGFLIAGIPSATLLGFVTFFLSMIPVGPPLIWGPAGIWLITEEQTAAGIFLLIWGVVVVGGADNIVKPLLISRGSNLSFVLIFLGVIGGALEWGLQGVFLGPTILAVGYSLLKEWMVPTRNVDSPGPKPEINGESGLVTA